MLKGEEYKVESDVSCEVLGMFLARLFGRPSSSSVTEENAEGLKALCDELGFSGFDADLKAILGEGDAKTRRNVAGLVNRVDRHDILLERLKRQVAELSRCCAASQALEARVEEIEKSLREGGHAHAVWDEVAGLKEATRRLESESAGRWKLCEDSLTEFRGRVRKVEDSVKSCASVDSGHVSAVAGDVGSLRKDVALLKEGEARLEAAAGANWDAVSELCRRASEKNVLASLREKEAAFAREVVVRKSSHDLYGMLDPDSSDSYGSGNDPGAWIEIEFRDPVRVNGLRVTSSNRGSHPKTFDVTFSDGSGAPEKHRVSFVDEARLNGNGLSAEENFDAVSARLVRIESRGQNWSGSNFFRIGGFELFSPDEGHEGGVFRSIFARDRERVRDVFEARARDFDGSELHLPNGKNVWTWAGDHAWVEFGLVHGRVVPSRYRIKKGQDRLRGWTLRGSNDRNAALDDWAVLHRHREATEAEKTSEVLEFECPSTTPFRFFRIVQEEKEWDGRLDLNFSYFDVDGLFIRD